MAKTKAKIKAKIVKSKGKVKKAIKTRKSAAKRYRFTATGLVKVPRCGKQHKAASKTRHRKNRLKKPKLVRAESRRLISRCLPNSI